MISDKRVNIIYSSRNSGTTSFLYQLATIFGCEYSVCFIDGDGFGTDNSVFGEKKPNFLRLLNKNDVRMFEMINQTKDIDLILVDDIDMLSKDCFREVIKGSKSIICTCSTISQQSIPGLDNNLLDKYQDHQQFFLDKKTIEYNNNIMDRKSFLNRFKRDLKIKSLLK